MDVLTTIFLVITVSSCIVLSKGATNCSDLAPITNKGRSFLLTFPEPDSPGEWYKLYAASTEDGSLNLTRYTSSSSVSTRHYDIHAGVAILDIETASLIQTVSGLQTKVILIESNVDVALFIVVYYNGIAASYTGLPNNALSTHYVVSSFQPYGRRSNDIIVTAVDNNTVVNITDTSGNTNVYRLNSLESQNEKTRTDQSGFVVESDKPVSVISGSKCAEIPLDISDCDTLLDSPIPVGYWGKDFIVPPLKPRTGYLVRMFTSNQSSVNMTYMNSTKTFTGTFSGMYEILLGMDATFIRTDKPVGVVQYGLSNDYDHVYGDAFMTSVPAIKHYSNNYMFPSPLTDEGFVNRLVITIDRQYADGLRLDGKYVNGTWNTLSYAPYPYNNYSTLTVELTSGNHTLSHISVDVKFAALLYGLKYRNAFGFSLGFSFASTTYDECMCPAGFIGEHCDIVNECASSPCLNGAACINGPNGYTCSCAEGWTGTSCITDIDECVTNPCQNGATCINGRNAYTCTCSAGWTGRQCSIDIDECVVNPCQNGATCINGRNTYTCTCSAGWTGRHCSIDINECANNLCMNGATCTDGQNGYNCACAAGWTGTTCSTAIKSDVATVCFSCEDAIGLSYCDSIEYCKDNEKCYVERTATNEKHITFRSGCIHQQTCNMHEHHVQSSPTSPCEQCCDGNLCNSAGCDDPGLPPRAMRGPICLECSHVGNTHDCVQIKLCASDELCSIEEFTWGDQRNFHLGCKSKHQCSFGSRAVSISKRSVPVCHQCCEDDLCNTNCTVTFDPAFVG